jgi:hypothetical protein
MPRAGFKPAIPATKRQQTYALDRAATEISIYLVGLNVNLLYMSISVSGVGAQGPFHCEHFFIYCAFPNYSIPTIPSV